YGVYVFFVFYSFLLIFFFFFSSRRRHTRWPRDWSSDVCSSDLGHRAVAFLRVRRRLGLRAGVAAPDQYPVAAGGLGPQERLVGEAQQVVGRAHVGEVADARSEERRVGEEGRSAGGWEGCMGNDG